MLCRQVRAQRALRSEMAAKSRSQSKKEDPSLLDSTLERKGGAAEGAAKEAFSKKMIFAMEASKKVVFPLD